jgi:hypothetical protein
MSVIELRDLDKARNFILQSLWLQRAIAPPRPALVRTALEWALEIASSGEPLPPVGFVADLGVAAFGMDRGERRHPDSSLPISDSAKRLLIRYEDYVLGKVIGDWAFERASDALRSPMYGTSRDKARGLAFLITRFRRQAKFTGVLLSPGLLRTTLEVAPQETLAAGRTLLEQGGLMPELEQSYQSLVDAARRTAETLSEADLAALENGIALADEGQRLAHDQVIHASAELRRALPDRMPKPLANRQDVPTAVLDEDTYPVGGYSSIASRGSTESLLHSQLAFMEPQARPDLFDVKYLRDELYFYARDENQFLRRRRTFVFVFHPDLVHARFKDPEASYQRIVLLLGLVRACVQKLVQWLSGDALKFIFAFPSEPDQATPLQHEHELLRMQFQDQIENGMVVLMPPPARDPRAGTRGRQDASKPGSITEATLLELCARSRSNSLCQCISIACADRPSAIDGVGVCRLVISGPRPAFGGDASLPALEECEWGEALERLLQMCV